MSMNQLSSSPERTILIVEDDELLNKNLCQFLDKKGFITQSAYSYAQAVSQLKSAVAFDLIILDYQLGDGTGMEFLVELYGRDQAFSPPVIMISVSHDPVLLESCFASGIADFLIKPLNFSLLALKVGALIQTVAMQNLIEMQNTELERFKADAEHEQRIAKFTYEYLLRQNNQVIDGVTIWLKSSAAFSGDIALAKVSPGGDFYFLLADATGHGLSAAITLMPMVSIFNSMVDKEFRIQSIATEINKKLIHNTPENRFVAAVMIHLRVKQAELDVWNGGMPMVYWMCDGKIECQFQSQHMALGILDEDMFDDKVASCTLQSAGTLIAYSDGLIEEVDSEGKSFSMRRVADSICANPDAPLQALVNGLEQHTGRKSYRDDISICILEVPRILAACKQISAR